MFFEKITDYLNILLDKKIYLIDLKFGNTNYQRLSVIPAAPREKKDVLEFRINSFKITIEKL
jgi:hypothetical protein